MPGLQANAAQRISVERVPAEYVDEIVKMLNGDGNLRRKVSWLAVDGFNVGADKIAFQSSNAWDDHGASVFRFKVAWVNRFCQSQERLPGKPNVEIKNLMELLDFLK